MVLQTIMILRSYNHFCLALLLLLIKCFRVIRDESTGALDTSLLADHLKVLAGPFEGEDPNIDNMLTEFKETKVWIYFCI